MKIMFSDRNQNVIDAIQKQFQGMNNIDAQCATWDSRAADALVSPANCFGFMDGGIDADYLRVFDYVGINLQKMVQDRIKSHYAGEMLIGEAFALDTGYPMFAHLIVAPTMRNPGKVLDLDHIFLATRAAMRVALKNNYVSIMFPGMGTGTGKVSAEDAARQMFKGIDQALNPPPFPDNWWTIR